MKNWSSNCCQNCGHSFKEEHSLGTCNYVCPKCLAIKEVTIKVDPFVTNVNYQTYLDYAEDYRFFFKWFNKPIAERFSGLCQQFFEEGFIGIECNDYDIHRLRNSLNNAYITGKSIKNCIIAHGFINLTTYNFDPKLFDRMLYLAFTKIELAMNKESHKDEVRKILEKIKEWEHKRGYL